MSGTQVEYNIFRMCVSQSENIQKVRSFNNKYNIYYMRSVSKHWDDLYNMMIIA